MGYWDKECPSDPRDAFREGRRARSTERNPYEHGRDPWADRECQEAHEEWSRGKRYSDYEREDQRIEEEKRARLRRARPFDEEWGGDY